MRPSIDTVAETLREAVQAVEAADVPASLRPAAFTAAVGLLASAASEATSTEAVRNGPVEQHSARAASLLGKIARRVGAAEDVLSYLYEEEQGDLRLVIRRAMLPHPDSRAAAMRDIGALVLAGRQAAELEEWTGYDTIRRECEELNVLDGPNFATELQKLDIRVRGAGRAKEAKLTRHGFDRAAELIRTMVQGFAQSQALV